MGYVHIITYAKRIYALYTSETGSFEAFQIKISVIFFMFKTVVSIHFYVNMRLKEREIET